MKLSTFQCSQAVPQCLYLTVRLHIHLTAQNERLEVDVGFGGDGSSFPRLADHCQPLVETALVVELPQVGLAVHFNAVLGVRVAPHQALHVAHIKLFQLQRKALRSREASKSKLLLVNALFFGLSAPYLQVLPHDPGHMTGPLLQRDGNDMSAGQAATHNQDSLAHLTHSTLA